jgi:hypothetical protein
MLDNLMESQHKLERANQQLDAKISQLSEKNIELFKANNSKANFWPTCHNEFRTPLTRFWDLPNCFAKNLTRSGEIPPRRKILFERAVATQYD